MPINIKLFHSVHSQTSLHISVLAEDIRKDVGVKVSIKGKSKQGILKGEVSLYR